MRYDCEELWGVAGRCYENDNVGRFDDAKIAVEGVGRVKHRGVDSKRVHGGYELVCYFKALAHAGNDDFAIRQDGVVHVLEGEKELVLGGRIFFVVVGDVAKTVSLGS